MLLYLKNKLELDHCKTDIILFKSDLNEDERQRISRGTDLSVITNISGVQSLYDYKTNWLWFIICKIAAQVERSDLISGADYLDDLLTITGVSERQHQSIFSGLKLSKIKTDISTKLNTGVFKSDVKAQVELIKTDAKEAAIDVIEIAERCLSKLKFKPRKKICIFFDELELFWNKSDQRNRDLALIRDLLYAVARINRKVSATTSAIIIYASVRTEVLDAVNQIGAEVTKETDDFGIHIDWSTNALSPNQPLLRIVENKIRASELECGEDQTNDVWAAYFPARLYGRDFRQQMLDTSMFRPRNLVRRLILAQRDKANQEFSPDDFKDTQLRFSQGVWREIEEELQAVYSPAEVQAVKAILSGFKIRFKFQDIAPRITAVSQSASIVRGKFQSEGDLNQLINILYRSGAIGNLFSVGGSQRDRWIFRGYPEPLLDKDFVVHESLRKSLQLEERL